MTRQGLSSRRETRAAQFASQFGACAAHRREARSVHRALEQLAKHALPDLDPEATLAELLPAARGVLSAIRHDAVTSRDHYVTLAQAVSKGAIVREALQRHLAERIRTSLLGPAAARSTWQAHTLGARSVRGVVNERVRWLGGCQCAG
jgi:hypothetical protein